VAELAHVGKNLEADLDCLAFQALITVPPLSDVTRILESIKHGDPKAADELLPLVYAELRKLAAYKMAQGAAGHTLQPTALVHEV
jgi:hypothetical protein